MTPVNNYLTQREREMTSSQLRPATVANTAQRSGLVQRLVRAFGARDTRLRSHRSHATVPPRHTGYIQQTMPGEVI